MNFNRMQRYYLKKKTICFARESLLKISDNSAFLMGENRIPEKNY